MAIRPAYIEGLSNTPDEIIGEYDRLCSFIDEFAWYKDQKLLEVINNSVPATCKRGLDIGCGTGIPLRYLGAKRRDVKWTGIDQAPEMVATAKLKCADLDNILIVDRDWMEFSRESRSRAFDFILLKNVLHLVTNVGAHLSTLRQLLSPAGRILIVETVSPNSDSKRLIGGLMEALDKVEIKKHIFTSRELVKVIRRSSLEAQRIQYHEQFIDVEKWIGAKALSQVIAARALSYLGSEMRSEALRKSMKYEAPASHHSGKMLRLQLVVQCVPTPMIKE